MDALSQLRPGLYVGTVDGEESGHCVCRIEVRRLTDHALSLDYEAFGADGLQHVEHTIITGSTRGIGRAIAEQMALAGANVVISSRKAEACAKIAAETGHEVYTLTPDQIAAWRKAAEPLTAQWASEVPNADKVLSDLKADLKKHDALAE